MNEQYKTGYFKGTQYAREADVSPNDCTLARYMVILKEQYFLEYSNSVGILLEQRLSGDDIEPVHTGHEWRSGLINGIRDYYRRHRTKPHWGRNKKAKRRN
jgi:hypothetical protein